MKNTLFAFISFFLLCCKTQILKLSNSDYLTISDSLKIELDSLTIANSSSVFFKDSILLITNEVGNSVSMINLDGSLKTYYNFNPVEDIYHDFKVDAAWFTSDDSIFIYSGKTNHIYLFNNKKILIDSFSTKSVAKAEVDPPIIHISSSQMPCMSRNVIYCSGFSLGENTEWKESKKFVISGISKDSIHYFVNYPLEYNNKNWGGVYYRMIHNCVVEDSMICISFGASNQIALFNTYSNNVRYIKLYPNMDEWIKPFKGVANKQESALHYFSQYSFREIIYDKFRKLYYRILVYPASKENIKSDKLGIQKKAILVYDRSLKYLGYTELKESISPATFFVSKKGLFVKYFKNKKDEDNMYFYLFTVNGKSK